MTDPKDDTIKVELPASIEEEITDKIAASVKNSYFGNVASIVGDKVKEKLEEDGFCERVADAVVSRMKLDEDEYTEGITEILKKHVIETVGSLTGEVLKKVNEQFSSYGFIKIGR